MLLSNQLEKKAKWVWEETLRVHKIAPETRIASSLSSVEILTGLYYGGVLNFNAEDPLSETRDRLVISKGHGVVCLYPILADLGFFPAQELDKVGQKDTLLGVIPDSNVPGIETTNGSVGHGLGVACGIALALKYRKSSSKVFVLSGDGELNAGPVWEAIMFAGHHKLDNLTMVVDNNKKSMLGIQKDILGLAPLDEKFSAFNWHVSNVDGHNVIAFSEKIRDLKSLELGKPKVLVADTVKGNGVKKLEENPICHVLTLGTGEVDSLLGASE